MQPAGSSYQLMKTAFHVGYATKHEKQEDSKLSRSGHIEFKTSICSKRFVRTLS